MTDYDVKDLEDGDVGVSATSLHLRLNTAQGDVELHMPTAVVERIIRTLRLACDDALELAHLTGRAAATPAMEDEPLRPEKVKLLSSPNALKEVWLAFQWATGRQMVVAVPRVAASEVGRALMAAGRST